MSLIASCVHHNIQRTFICATFYAIAVSPRPRTEARAQSYLRHHSVPIASHRAGHTENPGECLLNN